MNSSRRDRWAETGCVCVLAVALAVVAGRDFLTFRRPAPPRVPDVDFLDTGSRDARDAGEVAFRSAGPTVCGLQGTGWVEFDGKHPFRHALGPTTRLLIASPARGATLWVSLHNPVPGQTITVRGNGEILEATPDLPVGPWERVLPLTLAPGFNEFRVEFATSLPARNPGDARAISGTFRQLALFVH